MTTDLGRVLRRRKPEKRTEQLAIRAPDDLVEAGSAPQGPQAVVLDTTVYIHEAAGTLSPTAESLMDRALLFHCSVCLAELAVGIANGDPRHPRWPETRSHYEEVMKAIPETRLLVPDDEVWLDAGVIAGTLARTQNLQKHQRKEILNDALIYLTAARRGLPVLTANRDEFDLVQQLVPEGAFYFYDSLR